MVDLPFPGALVLYLSQKSSIFCCGVLGCGRRRLPPLEFPWCGPSSSDELVTDILELQVVWHPRKSPVSWINWQVDVKSGRPEYALGLKTASGDDVRF